MRKELLLLCVLLLGLGACAWPMETGDSLQRIGPAAASPIFTPPGDLAVTQAPASPTVLVTGAATDLPVFTHTLTTTPQTTPPRTSSLLGGDFRCSFVEGTAQQAGESGAQQAGVIPRYRVQVVKAYPHDPAAYTQGLFFQDGVLYESTGQYGFSSLRKVDLESGDVLQQVDLPEQYFAEGLTALGERIYQLTWQENLGFVYQKDDFSLQETFSYPGQGWGLTQDGERLIMSEGSSQLIFLDPDHLQATGGVVVRNGDMPVELINELEYIEGEVWANIYKSACIARIDPHSGQVVGWVDISGLLTPQEMARAEVPNGIAYDAQTGRIFVTGKWWPWVFEIELLAIDD